MNTGYEIIYKKNDSKKFWNLFDILKLKHPNIGSIYHPAILDYYFIRAFDEGYQIEDFSCIFTYDDVPFSGFIGAKFSKGLNSELNLFELPCLAIDSNNISLSKKKKIKSFLDVLLKLNFDKIQLKGPDLDSKLPILCEFLLSKPNFKLNPSTTRVIDLGESEVDIRRAIRKSYHSLINWGLNTMEIEIHDKSNIKWNTIESFRDLHIREAKRETRSIDTWKKQFEAINCGLAFCVTGKLEKELVSAAYFLCPDGICYYGSSASRRDLFTKPLSHAIIWKAILESKKRGAFLFNIGTTFETKFNNLSTSKEKNIAYFKEGFGGNLRLNYIIEKNND